MNSKRTRNLFIVGSRVGESFEISRPVSARLIECADNPAQMSRFGFNTPNPREYEYHSFSSDLRFPAERVFK